MVRSLPLRNGFFQTPQLAPPEEIELLGWARSLIPDLAYAEAEWTLVHERKDFVVQEDRQKGGLTYSVQAVASIPAPLEDVMDMFVVTTTTEFRALMQVELGAHAADAAVLLHREMNECETLAIKWIALRNRKAGLNLSTKSHSVDLCVMEYTGVVGADILGGDPDKPLGIVLFESIQQPECPSLYESHKLERGTVSKCGYIFRPLDDGGVEATFVCSIRQPPNKSGRRRTNRALLLNWAESVGQIEDSITRKRISRDLMMRRSPNWVDDKDRQCCHLCMKTFSNTRRRHHCRACGEIICRGCSLYKSVDLQTVGLTTLRVCKGCMDASKSINQMSSSVTRSQSDAVALPPGVNDEVLRDAVEEYALTLPTQQVSAVPDLVGLAWLKQLADRDPSKTELINGLIQKLQLDAEFDQDPNQVDIYDTLCDLAAQALTCKYAVVSLIDENRQWFKSAVNVQESDVPRDFSFCEYPVRDRLPLVVMDATKDPRFVDNPFVTGPLCVRFLAGAPLFTVDNVCVGAVCVMDTDPRMELQDNQIATMQNLAHLAMVMVQERREARAKLAKTLTSSQLSQQLVPATRAAKQIAALPRGMSASEVSDMVPLHGYANEQAIVAKTNGSQPQSEDPELKEQMIQLLHKASQVCDQVTMQSTRTGTSAQHPGLQTLAE